MANRGFIYVETGPGDMVCIVAKVSYHAEFTVQPGIAALGLADPDAFQVALAEVVSPSDVWLCGGVHEAEAEAQRCAAGEGAGGVRAVGGPPPEREASSTVMPATLNPLDGGRSRPHCCQT